MGIKWNVQTGGNAVLSGQQKQQNVPAGHVIKVVAAVMDYALWLLFLPGFLSLVASDRATGVVLSLFQYSQLVSVATFP